MRNGKGTLIFPSGGV
ncbi:MAG: hypothetical protein ACI3ZP_11590 [Candidatus Cryptobacteroides sp.]